LFYEKTFILLSYKAMSINVRCHKCQQEHNRTILSMLNTGNLDMPTAFPTIRINAGLAIHYHQERHIGINSIQELKNIEGLTRIASGAEGRF